MDTVVQKKLNQILNKETTITSVATELGVSRQTLYKWLNQYKRQRGFPIFETQQKSHKAHNKISKDIEDLVISTAKNNPNDSVSTLATKLVTTYGVQLNPTTIFRVLKRNNIRYTPTVVPVRAPTALYVPETIPVSTELPTTKLSQDVLPHMAPAQLSSVTKAATVPTSTLSSHALALPSYFLRQLTAFVLVGVFGVVSLYGAYQFDGNTSSFTSGEPTASPNFEVVSKVVSVFDEVNPSPLSPSTFSLTSLTDSLASLVKQGPRIAKLTLLPLETYQSFALGGYTVQAQRAPNITNANATSFLDRLSLTVFCSLSANKDSSRCNYDTLLALRGTPDTTTILGYPVEETPTVVAVATSTPSTTQTSPRIVYVPQYITNYVTEYVLGTPGKDGKDGKDGTSTALVNSTSIPSGFGSYSVPSVTSPSLIGATTIGYLRDATIEKATVSDSIFNGYNLFNNTAIFTGFVGVNSLAATTSVLTNATITTSTTTDAFISNLSSTNNLFTNATTTNSYISALIASSSTLTDALLTNSTTTRAYVANLIASSSTLQDVLLTNATTTNAYIQNLVVASSSVTDALFTNATTTNFVATNATSTNLFAQALTAVSSFFTNLTATNATTTNLIATNATSTNLFAGTGFVTNLVTTAATSTNLFSTNAFFTNLDATNINLGNATTTNFVATNATTTRLFTQNLAVGNATTQGNQTINGDLIVSGTTTVAGNITLGTSTATYVSFNGLINSNVIPAANKMYDLGSPSFYWRDLYADNINVNTISAASTTISGTSNNTFSINSDNATTDGEDVSLVFFRGLVTPNALLRWNATTKRLEANMSFKVQNETPITGTTTLTVQGGAGQGTTNLLEVKNNGGTTLTVIDAQGRVGIGSSTPGSALTVVGNAYVGGNVTATGTLDVTGQTTLSTASSTGLTATNLYSTNTVLTNATSTFFAAVNATTTNATTTRAYITSLVAASSTLSDALLTRSTSTDAYITRLVAASSTLTDAIVTTLNATSLTATNATLTNASTTNLSATGATLTNLFSSVLNAVTAAFTTLTTTGTTTLATGGGNVGVGTTSPTAELHVSGSGVTNVRIETTAASDSFLDFVRQGVLKWSLRNDNAGTMGTDGFILTDSAGNEKIGIAQAGSIFLNGNVGIGTTTPETALSVASAANAMTSFYNTANNRMTQVGVLDGFNGGISQSAGIIRMAIAGGDWVNIGSGGLYTNFVQGNVGIGTTTPGSKLTVVGASSFVGNVLVGGSTGTANVDILDSVADSSFALRATSPTGFIGLMSMSGAGTWNPLVGSNDKSIIFSSSTQETGNLVIGPWSASSKGIKIVGATGNVGIGTSTPGSLFSVQGSAYFGGDVVATGTLNVTGQSTFTTASSTGLTATNLYGTNATLTNATSTNFFTSLLNAVTAGFTNLTTTGTTTLATGGGRVGVGTGSPLGKLQVVTTSSDGNVATWGDGQFVVGQSGNTGGLGVSYDTSLNSSFISSLAPGIDWKDLGFRANNYNFFVNGGTQVMKITNTGNVGVGTTTPSAKLDINSSGTAVNIYDTVTSNIRLSIGTAGSPDFRASLQTYQHNTGGILGNLTLQENGGNVGIGTTSPTQKLEVQQGNIRINSPDQSLARLQINNTGISGREYALVSGVPNVGQTGFTLYDMTANASRLVVDAAGNVGMGTVSPEGRLTISGGSLASTGDAGHALSISSGLTTGRLLGGGSAVVSSLHTYYDSNAVEVTAGSTAGHVSGITIGARSYNGTAGSDAVALWTRNTQRLTVDATGNVGIGTTSPTSKLHLAGSVADLNIQYTGTAGNNEQKVNFMDLRGQVNAVIGNSLLDDGAGTYGARLVFKTSQSGTLAERMRIDANGNVGIGSTAPGYKLTVNPTTQYTGINTGDGLQINGGTIGTAANLVFGLSGTTANVIQSRDGTSLSWPLAINPFGGNVGIGTTNPAFTSGTGLEIERNGTATLRLDSQVYGTELRGLTNGTELMQLSAGYLALGTANTERMRIDSTGNIGVGTGSPQEKVDVVGSVLISAANANDNDSPGFIGVSNDDFLYNGLYLNHYGLGFHDPTQSANLGAYFSGYGGIDLFTSGANRVSIVENGNVGIGTTNPTAKLDISSAAANTPIIKLTSQEAGGDGYFMNFGYGSINHDSAGAVYTNWGSHYNGTTNAWVRDYTGLPLVNTQLSTNGEFMVNTETATSGVPSFTTRLMVANSGNVGVGTTNPGTKLEVNAAAPTRGILSKFVNTSSNTTGAYLSIAASGANVWSMGLPASGSPDFAFFSGRDETSDGNERMRITSTGNVGIGTTNPGTKLEVSGGLAISDASYLRMNGVDVMNRDTNLNFWAGSGNVIFNNGNVGIGTTTPSYKLDVNGNFRNTGDFMLSNGAFSSSGSTITSNSDFFNVNSSSVLLGNDTSDTVSISGGTMYFPGNGKVGVGTNNPTAKFEVSDNGIGAFEGFSIQSSYSNSSPNSKKALTWRDGANIVGSIDTRYNGTTVDMVFGSLYNSGYNSTDRMVVKGDGRVGIGTNSPDYKLVVSNGGARGLEIDPTDTQIGGGVGLQAYNRQTSAYVPMQLYSSATYLMGGNVGIGTTNPGSKLEVAGDVGFSGDLKTSAISKITPIFIRGTGYNNVSSRQIKIGSTNYAGDARGLMFTIINKATHAVVSTTNYDTYGDTAASNNLATALNGLTNQQIGILVSYDAWEGAHTANLKAAFLRLGLMKAYHSGAVYGRTPYAAIFEGGSSGVAATKAVEVQVSSNASQIYADISGWIMDGAYAVTPPTGNNTLYTPEGTTPALTVDGSGFVGVGTTTPIDKLQVDADNTIVGRGEFMGSNLLYGGDAEDIYTTAWVSRDFGIDGSSGGGSYTAAAAFSGTYSFYSSNDGGFNQAVSVVPGAVYTLSMRMRVYNTNSGDASNGYAVVGSTATGRDIADKICNPDNYDVSPNLNKWVLCSVTFTAPAATDASLTTVYVGGRAAGNTHSVVFDNVTLVRGGLVSSFSPLSNFLGTGNSSISGNLGVGTSTPFSGKFVADGGVSQVAGFFSTQLDNQITLHSNNAWTGIKFDDSAAGDDFLWFNGTNKTFAIGGGGANIAGKKLHIDGGTTIGVNYDAVSGPNDGLYVEGQTWLNGNVGIGTTTPGTKLHVVGNSTYTGFGGGQFRIGAETGQPRWTEVGYNTSTNVGFIQAGINGGALSSFVINPDGGNVGIGTAPFSVSTKLSVNGDLTLAGGSTLGAGTISANQIGINVDLTLRPGATSALRLQNWNGSGWGDGIVLASSTLNVGIGTSTPGSRLDVWNATSTSNIDVFRIGTNVGSTNNIKFRIDSDGDVFTDGGTTIGTPADLAENYPALEALDAGTVVAFGSSTVAWEQADDNASSTQSYDISGVQKATNGYEAVGVVSTKAGITLGGNTTNGVPIALAGRVPVKVTSENGEVKRGDYLTVSNTMPGYAMKLTQTGRVIGRALSDSVSGRDKVMMYIENGYQQIDLSSASATTTLLTKGNLALDANGVAIINIKSLSSANGTWSIDESGRIVAKALCIDGTCLDGPGFKDLVEGNGSTPKNGAMHIIGAHAFLLSATTHTLRVLDIAAGDNPVIVASLTLPEGVTSLSANGTYLYVNNSDLSMLYIVDVTSPTQPTLLRSINTGLATEIGTPPGVPEETSDDTATSTEEGGAEEGVPLVESEPGTEPEVVEDDGEAEESPLSSLDSPETTSTP